MTGRKKDLMQLVPKGQRWGRLAWTGEEPQRGGSDGYEIRMPVVCDCGTKKLVALDRLRGGITKSCGCLRKEMTIARSTTHGLSRTRAKSVWSTMWNRCTNPIYHEYHLYGGRGIKPCKRWKSLAAFVEDMGQPPPGLWLDRKNNEKGYSKSNCRWATPTEQNRNRRDSLYFLWKGKKRHLKDLCAEHKIDYHAVYYRLGIGWSIKKALETPSLKASREPTKLGGTP